MDKNWLDKFIPVYIEYIEDEYKMKYEDIIIKLNDRNENNEIKINGKDKNSKIK